VGPRIPRGGRRGFRGLVRTGTQRRAWGLRKRSGRPIDVFVGAPHRILFVDDEASILDGLQNLLRKQRHVWDMVFSLGGEAALAELRKGPFDVIVSDMRMPGMDGAALLTAVREAYPNVARIVLSGQAEREALARALPVAHQFLSKPCDGEILKIVIDRACKLQRLLQDETIRKAVGRLDALPSAAATYRELTETLADPDVGLNAVAAIVERDPAMSAKVLQLVNSAYFGLASKVTSVTQAMVYLGADTMKGLVLTSQVFSLVERPGTGGLSLELLQQHSLLTARLAKRLVTNPRMAEDAFTAGLLHDIGQIVLLVSLRDRYTALLRDAQKDSRPLHLVEDEHLGVSHAEVGAYLLGVWGLPFSVVEAVAYHHRPGLVDAGDREVLAAVHVADTIIEAGEENGAPTSGLDRAFLEASGWAAAVPKAREWTALTAVDGAGMPPLRGGRRRASGPRST
jgi:HD-like signal output (HDOD) protein